jgi:hypothetical protein
MFQALLPDLLLKPAVSTLLLLSLSARYTAAFYAVALCSVHGSMTALLVHCASFRLLCTAQASCTT